MAMTIIVAVRYLVTSGGFALLTARVRPGLYARLGPQMGREIRWSLASAAIYGVPAGAVAWGWQARGWTLIYDRWDAYPLWLLPLSVIGFLARARHMVLLDAPMDAPAAPVSHRPRRPPRQPPTHRMGGDGISPL